MRKEVALILVVLMLVFPFVKALGPNPGVVDGYVDDTEGHPISGAMVSANGGSGTTDDTSYYVFSADNPKNGPVKVTATYGGGEGSVTVTSDNSRNARAYVTICYAPTKPTITSSPSGQHETTIKLEWNSGEEVKFGYPTYDVVTINGKESKIEGGGSHSLVEEINFGNYVWSVKTCNIPPKGVAHNDVFCCSDAVGGGYGAGNKPPSTPSGEGSSNEGLATLSWVSGIDPEGDATYDEFRFSNSSVEISPAVSPYITPAEVLINWEIRTCDIYGACSPWNEIHTVTCSKISSECPSSEKVNSLLKVFSESTSPTEVYCNGLKYNGSLLRLDLNFKEGKKISFKNSLNSIEDLNKCPWCYDGIKNYDETEVDCGGVGCPSCSFLEQRKLPLWIIWIILFLVAFIFIYWYYKKKKGHAGVEYFHPINHLSSDIKRVLRE